MRTLPRFSSIALLLLTLALGSHARAADFELSVVGSPSPVFTNSTLTYTIALTNRAGVTLTDVLVNDTLSATATVLEATNSSGTASNTASSATFLIPSLTNGQFAVLTLTAQPTAIGPITNTVVVSATNASSVTNVSVITAYAAIADLAVGLTGFSSGVISHDVTTYTITMTNRGPDATVATDGVVVSNRLPAGMRFISVFPTNPAISFGGDSLRFNLGPLAAGGGTSFQVTVQPTNVGDFTFLANISSIGLFDTNAANDNAAANLTVGEAVTGQLVAILVSPQRYNPQTGLMEQTARLSNVGTNTVAAARIIVSGLTNQLFNAAGTNSGSPYVVYGAPLGANERVELILEYFVPTRLPVADPTLLAVEVPVPNLTTPTDSAPNIARFATLPSGDVLIEFEAVPGRSYTVLYSSNASFTNALAAQPAIIAPANRVHWIDNGPPKTISAPGTSRFYRVRLNPD